MLESKGGKRIFSVVSMIWQSPLIHVVTPIKGLVTSQVTKMRALTKSLRLPSPAWWSSNHEQGQTTFGLPQSPQQAPKVTPITKTA
jgi:hypothetical protein